MVLHKKYKELKILISNYHEFSANSKNVIISGLIIITFLSYYMVIYNDFVAYDDLPNIETIYELTRESAMGVFSPIFTPYWDPATRLLYLVTLTLFGENAFGFHLISMLLHILNVVLLFEILLKLNVRSIAAMFIALLFAVHPINVETVAWASAVNNLLSTWFILMSVNAYIEYRKKQTIWSYCLILLFMALGLMAKPSAVILPVMLVFIDISLLNKSGWEIAKGKYQAFKLVLYNKLPLLCLSISYSLLSINNTASNILTNYMFSGQTDSSVIMRIANAIISYVIYLSNLFWPLNLSFFYPLQPSYPVWQVLGAGFVMIGVSAVAILERKKRPWIIFGWLWYIITLFPSIGLFRQGVWPEHADRYAYVPFLGLYVIIAFFAQEVLDKGRVSKACLSLLSAVPVLAMIFITSNQVSIWNNTISLCENAIRVTPDNILATTILGDEYYIKGDYKNAIRIDEMSKKINPLFVNYELTLAIGNYYKKNYSKALARFERIHFIEPENLDTIYFLGQTNKVLNNRNMSIRYFNEYLEKTLAAGSQDNQYVDIVRKEIASLKAAESR